MITRRSLPLANHRSLSSQPAEDAKRPDPEGAKQQSRKTIDTAVGPLPISPWMDDEFHESRTRWQQPKQPESPSQNKEKWRRKLERNAFGTSIRRENTPAALHHGT